jgi:predicted permease
MIRRLRALITRGRLDDQLVEEIRMHLDLRTRSLVERGMDPADAAAEARRQFGNVLAIRERSRDAWIFPALSSIVQDVRFALRMIGRGPGYAAIVVLTIALGTALNGAVFVLLNAFLLRPPDIDGVAEVVRLDDGKPVSGLSYPDYVDYRDRVTDAVDLAAYSSMGVDLRSDRAGGVPVERVTAVLASGNYFDVLRARALVGRTFDGSADHPPSGTPVVVLGEIYWTRRYNRDPNIVGRTIFLNRQPFIVVGVVPASFRGVFIAGGGAPTLREMYVPLWCRPLLEPGDDRLVQRTTWWELQVVGRLKPGATLAQARARVAAAAAALDSEYPGLRNQRTPYLGRIDRVDPRLLLTEAGLIGGVMSAATLLVLLIACANVANLGLARSAARSRETAIRYSIGAGRGRIVRQFMTESLVLSLFGTGLGFALALAALGVAASRLDGQPFALPLTLDVRVTLYGALVAVLVSLVTGIGPALQASATGLLPALKDGAGGRRRGRLRGVFVGSEVAICLMLLVVTLLMVRSIQRARTIDPVIPVATLLTIGAGDVKQLGYAGPAQAALMAKMEQRLSALPGVTATALVRPSPFSRSRHGTTLRRADAQNDPGVQVHLSNVSAAYFSVVDMPMLLGRSFADGASDEIVVNRTLAARLWGDADPIGKIVTAGAYSPTRHVVVGVVRDAPFVSLQLRDEPFMFRPIAAENGGEVLVRTAGPARSLVRAAEAAAREADARLSISAVAVADGVEAEIASVGNITNGAAALGGLALLLALFGVGAVTANAVAQRTHEIGVRMALGANTGDAVALVVRQSMRPVLGGVALGLIGAALLGRALAWLLYGLSGIDPLAFLSGSGFLLAATLIASWIPARRAARVDPLIALRAE